MAKPVHPAFVHFPIAFLMLGFGMDILYQLRPNLPGAIANNLPVTTDLTRASYYLISIGLITVIPAVVTGGAEAIKMISKQGMYEADGKTIKLKVKATIAHAVVNDVMIAATTYIWYTRRAIAADSLAGKLGVGAIATPAAAYAPAPWMVAVETLALGLVVFASGIGGTLTYNYGVGFSTLSSSKKVQ